MSSRTSEHSRFPFTDEISPFELAEVQYKLLQGHHPLYTWGRAAGLRDDQIMDRLQCRQNRYSAYKKGPIAMPYDPSVILDYLEGIGVHPSYVMHGGDHDNDGHALPLSLVKVLAQVASDNYFSAEDRNEAMNALYAEDRKFYEWSSRYLIIGEIEKLWEAEVPVKTTKADHVFSNVFSLQRRLSNVFCSDIRDRLYRAELMASAKIDRYEGALQMRHQLLAERCDIEQERFDYASDVIDQLEDILFDEETDGYIDRLIEFVDDQSWLNDFTTREAWLLAAEQLKKRGSDLFKLLDSQAIHGRAVINGREVKWPETVEMFCRTYYDYHDAEVELSVLDGDTQDAHDEIVEFGRWRRDQEASGDLELYKAAHIIHALHLDTIRKSISVGLGHRLASSLGANQRGGPGG